MLTPHLTDIKARGTGLRTAQSQMPQHVSTCPSRRKTCNQSTKPLALASNKPDKTYRHAPRQSYPNASRLQGASEQLPWWKLLVGVEH